MPWGPFSSYLKISLIVPAGVVHAYKNVGDRDGGGFNAANRLYAGWLKQEPGDEIRHGILGCQCCVFPVIDGIPVMHLQANSNAARLQIEQGRPDLALRAMVGLDRQEDAERFEATIASPSATFRDIVEALHRLAA